jgi:hypothetical protein
VDFLFIMREPSARAKGCLRQEVFGKPAAFSAQPGSDHFGVLDTYIADASECSVAVPAQGRLEGGQE